MIINSLLGSCPSSKGMHATLGNSRFTENTTLRFATDRQIHISQKSVECIQQTSQLRLFLVHGQVYGCALLDFHKVPPASMLPNL